MAYGWGPSFSNPFTTLNWTRSPGNWVYNDKAMGQYTPAVREKLLEGYYGELGLTDKEVFYTAVNNYFTAQTEAFNKCLDEHPTLTADEKNTHREGLLDKQKSIGDKAQNFDDKIPGHTKVATHPSDLLTFSNTIKGEILTEINTLDPIELLGEEPAIPALKKDFEEAQTNAQKTLEKKLGETVTAFHQAAQRERDLIAWLAAVECGKRKAQQQFFLSSDPGYDVMMSETEKLNVKYLHQAIHDKNAEGIQQAGGLETQSGIPITVGQDDKNQLTFAIKFPAAWLHRGYYTASKHNSKADLLFQAALVRGTGAKTIVTNINHSNKTIGIQLAREAFEAAQEIGYEPKEITIKLNGTTIEEKDLFTQTLDIHHPGKQQPQVNVKKGGFADLARRGEDEITNPTDPNPQRQEEKQKERQKESIEAQEEMKHILSTMRPSTSDDHVPEKRSHKH